MSILFLKIYNTVVTPNNFSDQLAVVGLFLWIITRVIVLYYNDRRKAL